jgi:hypothetical protein
VRFSVEGGTLMPREEVERVQRFASPERTLAGVQRARLALEAAYARLGYGATQVVLPEREIKDGVVADDRRAERKPEGDLAAQVRADDQQPWRFSRGLEGEPVRQGPCPRASVLSFDYGFQIQRGVPPSSDTSRANFSLAQVFWRAAGEGRSEGSGTGELAIASPPGRSEGAICYHSIA